MRCERRKNAHNSTYNWKRYFPLFSPSALIPRIRFDLCNYIRVYYYHFQLIVCDFGVGCVRCATANRSLWPKINVNDSNRNFITANNNYGDGDDSQNQCTTILMQLRRQFNNFIVSIRSKWMAFGFDGRTSLYRTSCWPNCEIVDHKMRDDGRKGFAFWE